MSGISVRAAEPEPGLVAALADVLVDCVEGGASVGFMAPLDAERARRYWDEVLASAARGERVVMIAVDDASGEVLGTAQVVLAMPENQPHRGEVAKVLVRRSARRRGIGDALMDAVEAAAVAAGKWLLVLDTASADAERLYRRRGWREVGSIPDYALLPDGHPCATVIFDRRLA